MPQMDITEMAFAKVYPLLVAKAEKKGRTWNEVDQVTAWLTGYTPEELAGLKDFLSGQASDGWGEGLEQQAIRVDGGEFYVHLWQIDGWSIQTEAERFGQTQAPAKDMKHGTTMTMGGMSLGYERLHDLYTEEGLTEDEIGQLLVLDIKDADYFRAGGAPNQHGGGFLFAQDPEIMGWLFG